MLKPNSCTLIPRLSTSISDTLFKVACKLYFELPSSVMNSPELKDKILKSLRETGNLPFGEKSLCDVYEAVAHIKEKGPHGTLPYSLDIVTKLQEQKCYLCMTIKFPYVEKAQAFIKENHLTVV